MTVHSPIDDCLSVCLPGSVFTDSGSLWTLKIATQYIPVCITILLAVSLTYQTVRRTDRHRQTQTTDAHTCSCTGKQTVARRHVKTDRYRQRDLDRQTGIPTHTDRQPDIPTDNSYVNKRAFCYRGRQRQLGTCQVNSYIHC